jgi:hypothetical protein
LSISLRTISTVTFASFAAFVGVFSAVAATTGFHASGVAAAAAG